MDAPLHAAPVAVVVGGTLEALGGVQPPRPSIFYTSQPDALLRAAPGAFVPAELVAREAAAQAAAERRAAAAGPATAVPAGGGDAAGGGAPALDCLEACCLHDDLHLFSPAGPTRSLLTWARLPLPLLYEGSQFCYPLRQVELPAPALQLALNQPAAAGWDSCLWRANLPVLAARSAYTLTLLQLAEAAPGEAAGQRLRRQRRRRRRRRSGGSGSGSGASGRSRSGSEEEEEEEDGLEGSDMEMAAEEGEEEEEGARHQEEEEEGLEDAGGGFRLQRLCVVRTAAPTAHCCWQRHVTQRPLLLLEDGSLLEVQLGQAVQVVKAWQAPPEALPLRLQGVLQVQGGAQPRTALLALRDRLCRLDLRAAGGGGARGSLHPLWQCPSGQHVTAIRAPPPPPAGGPPGGSGGSGGAAAQGEHLLAAAASSGARGSGSRILLFDVRRPGQPVASWEQPPMDQRQHEAATLLRWLALPPGEAPTAGGGGGDGPAWRGLLVAGGGASGHVVGCHHSLPGGAAELQARGCGVTEKPAGSAALLLERLQAALEQQDEERAQQGQQEQPPPHQQASAAAAAEADGAGPAEQQGERLVPPALQAPPAPPLPLQLLWQPAHSVAAVVAEPGPPLLLVSPAEQQPHVAERMTAGRLLLQKQQAAAGGGIQVSKVPLPGQPPPPCQLLGLAAVAADWQSQQALPLPLLASLAPQGDALLSLLGSRQAAPASAAAAALPLLLPAARAGAGSDEEGEEGRGAGAAGAGTAEASPQGAPLLPYVRGVPRALVAAVAAGELERCGCCAKCLAAAGTCAAALALTKAGQLARGPLGQRRARARALLTVQAGGPDRSVVQLPLHMALARVLLAAQQPEAEQQGQQRAAAVQGVLQQLRRGISLHELHSAAQLQQQVDAYESSDTSSSSGGGDGSGGDDGGDGSSSSEDGGGGVEEGGEGLAAAAKQLRRQQRRLQEHLQRLWLRERRREHSAQHAQRQALLAALLAGQAGGAAGALPGQDQRRRGALSTQQRKRKSLAAAAGQRQEAASPSLEQLLQAAGLLPPRRPRGTAAEASAAPFGPAQQGHLLRPPSAGLLPAGAAFQAAAAAAAARAVPSPGGVAEEGQEEQEEEQGQGHLEWEMQPRSFVLQSTPPPPPPPQQQQPAGGGEAGGGQAAAAPAPRVHAAGPGASFLALVQRPAGQAGPSTSAAAAAAGGAVPLLRLRQAPPPSADAAAALHELREAWA